MISRTISGRFPVAGSRRAFSVLLLVWFNLAMLPCAMAFEKESDCPACPPGHEQAMTSHHSHGDGDALNSPACATIQPDCCDLGQVNFDDRSQKFEKQDSDKTEFVVASLFDDLWTPTARRYWSPSAPPDLVSGSPRLHALNCVYLD